MIFGIVLVSVLFLAVVGSLGLLIRDVRGLHHTRRSLADKPGDAAGVSAAGMVWVGNAGAR